MISRLALVLAFLVSSAAASTAESMRCGSRLVNEGDPKAKVARFCGKPTQSETRTILRAGFPRQNVRVGPDGVRSITDSELLIHDRSLVEVEVEVWLYNQGPTRLLREIVFRDNRVFAVNILGRGY